MLSLYQINPVFYSQYRLIIDGIQFIVRSMQLPFGFYVALTFAVVAGLAIIATLIGCIIGGIAVEKLSYGSRIGLALITLGVIASGFKYQVSLASPQMEVSSLGYKLEKNIYESIEVYRKIRAFDKEAPRHAYDYSAYDLVQKPNIYLIFVESYGSVLYKRPDFQEAYMALLGRLEGQLSEDGWHSTSTLSEAPVWGGGSWMSYTSALFGLRIDNHPQFLSLLDEFQSGNYPDLGYYLRTQGYEYARLSSLSDELGQEEWLKYKDFYGVDRWLQHSDLDYRGPLYGWGPAPPDQYALFFAHEAAISRSNKPIFFFFITQNSHYPWVPLPELVGDWRTLNLRTSQQRVPLPEPLPHQVKRSNYLNVIEYQLSFLTDFILKRGEDNAIFILIGDHQPQQVSRHDDGFDTPVHIISKDANFVDSFLDYGFVRGLTVSDLTPTIRHEGFYSMFMRALLACYGQGLLPLPKYLPDGMVLEDHASVDGD